MSIWVSSCSGRSILRIHQPGFVLGAKVIVCFSLPLNVPTPATDASPARVLRFVGYGYSAVSERRVSSIGCLTKRSYEALIEAVLPKTVRPIV